MEQGSTDTKSKECEIVAKKTEVCEYTPDPGVPKNDCHAKAAWEIGVNGPDAQWMMLSCEDHLPQSLRYMLGQDEEVDSVEVREHQ